MTRPAPPTTLPPVNVRFVAPELLAPGPALALRGGRDRASGRVVFPCPADATRYEPVALPARGTVWSWTVQRFAPKSPPYAGDERFEPFAVGYVELPGHVIVESRLTGAPLDGWRVGQAVELTTARLRTDPDGTTVETYAFRPAGAGA
jgi:uncharacterized OB-fold protein